MTLIANQTWAQENLFYKHRSDGRVFFQLQNVQSDSDYSVQLVDAVSSKVVAIINGFEPGSVPKALHTEWKPSVKLLVKGAVCHWSILRDGKNISPAVPEVAMPEKFGVAQAKIKRGLNGITWMQETPSISRVFVANRSGMLIAWVKPWGFSGVGSHLTSWNFKDIGGVRSYRTDSDIHAFVQRVPLGKRWLVIGDVKYTDQHAGLERLAKVSLPKIPYDFILSLPGSKLAKGTGGESDAVYHAHAGMPVRVSLDRASKKKMGGRRFEILLFLNGEFIHEEAQGVDPYTFILPEFANVSGKHHFTVNIIDYHGNIASKTVALHFAAKSGNFEQAIEVISPTQ
jgi:hypothetical protein